MTTLGIRNNNPGNIRNSITFDWEGQVGQFRGYCLFDKMENGIRAIAILMIEYQKEYALHTVRGLITRYAPSTENNTFAYITDVAEDLKCDANDEVDVTKQDELTAIVKAICHHENGEDAALITPVQLQAGVLAAMQSKGLITKE